MKFKKIYDTSPIAVQNLMTSIYGRKLAKERYTSIYNKHMLFLREKFFKLDHYKFQIDELNNFLSYVKDSSPFYGNKLQNLDLPLDSIEELKEIDQVNKEDIRENIDQIVTSQTEKLISSFTGGTTGKSLNIFYEQNDFEKRMAFLDYFKERHGVFKGMKRASFTGKDLIPLRQKKKVYWRYNKPLKQMLFSSFHLTEENIPFYIKELNRFKPKSLDGFPSVMVTLSKYILRNDISLEFQPIAIFPTAETITDYDREIIEKAFKSKVRNQYASSEGAPFITECPKGNLHLDIMTGVFERVDFDSSVSEILVTAFETKGTPLIRYKIGDLLEFTDEKCNCGYNTPVVNRILGRSMDFLYSKERGKISNANMSNTIKSLPNSIVNIQFIQEEIEEVKILVVKDKKIFKDEHEKDLLNEMKVRLGNVTKYSIDYVDTIPVESSGKYKMIKSSIQDQIDL